jgi:hypothetical protein
LQLNTVKAAQRGKSNSKDSHLGLEDSSEHNLASWMRTEGWSEDNLVPSSPKFLQSQNTATVQMSDTATVQRAMKTMASFMQAHGEEAGPKYSSQSGEIVGIMKQMKEEMEAELKDAQKTEKDRAANFDELSASKSQEIAEGEKMSEDKEDELATTANELAEAKEDLDQTQTALSEFQTFLANLEKTCAEADTNFEARKKTRMDEIKAVSMTIDILTSDEARDAANGTYSSLIQMKTQEKDCPYCAAQCVDKCHSNGGSYVSCLSECADSGKGFFFLQISNTRRQRASVFLRKQALKKKSPALSMLESKVEEDNF